MFLHELWYQMPNASLKSKSCIIRVFFSLPFSFLVFFKVFAGFFDIYDYTENLATSSFTFSTSYLCFCWLTFCNSNMVITERKKKDLTNYWSNLNHFVDVHSIVPSFWELLFVPYFILKKSYFYYHCHEGFPLFFIGIVVDVNLLLRSWRRCRISLLFFFSIFLIFFATIFHISNFVPISNPFFA